MLTTWPRSRATIPGSTARVMVISPLTLVSTISFQSSSEAALRRFEPARQARVVDQQVDRRELRRKLGDRARDGRLIAHVERQARADRRAELAREGVQPVGAAAGDDQAVTLAGEAAGDGGAEPGGGAGDEDEHAGRIAVLPARFPSIA